MGYHTVLFIHRHKSFKNVDFLFVTNNLWFYVLLEEENRMSRSYSIQEARKDLKRAWGEISDYLGLVLSWEELIKRLRKKYNKFIVTPGKEGRCWGMILREGKKSKKNKKGCSIIGVNFCPTLSSRDEPRYQLGHELVHLYRMVFLPEFWKVSTVLELFEEAYADVISVKSIRNRKVTKKIDFLRRNYYSVPEIAMLSEALYKLGRKDLVRYTKRPFNTKDARIVFKRSLSLIEKAEQAKWLKIFFRKIKRDR